jgi:transposase
MNAATSLLLQKRVDTYPHQPMLRLWNCAPWHQGPALRHCLADHPSLAIFLCPPGLPDLNPQEHVWKDVRTHVSHHQTVKQLDRMADQFEDYLETIPKWGYLWNLQGWDSLLVACVDMNHRS